MIFSSITRVYNDAFFLETCLLPLLHLMDEVVVIEGSYQYTQEKKLLYNSEPRSTDESIQIVRELRANHPLGYKIKLIHRNGKNHVDQMSYFWEVSSTTIGDYVFIVDADELYFQNDLEYVINYIRENDPVYNIRVRQIQFITEVFYNKCITGIDIGGKIVEKKFRTDRVLKTDKVLGRDNSKKVILNNISCYHCFLNKPISKLKFKLKYNSDYNKLFTIENDTLIYKNQDCLDRYLEKTPWRN